MPAPPLGSPKVPLAKNRILAALPRQEFERLLPHLEFRALRQNEVLYRSGETIRHVYFPLDAVVSLLASMKDGRQVEVGSVGREGLLGMRALLGSQKTGFIFLVQIPGECVRIKAARLQAEFQRGGVLQDRMLRYVRCLLAQIAQTAACNRLHQLEQRFARWLLMASDQVGSREFPITHEFLSHMIGTPRSEITRAAAKFREMGFIRYRRGRMTILNQQALESVACECHEVIQQELRDDGKDRSSARCMSRSLPAAISPGANASPPSLILDMDRQTLD